MLLMCKDMPVYDIEAEKVINFNLLPGLMKQNPCNRSFKNWLRLRYSSDTNAIARQLKGIIFGQGNRITIDKSTRALSLYDCYWLADSNTLNTFSSVSPYYNNFWTGIGNYMGESIPTLYVNGYLSKYWANSEWLIKCKDLIEIECSNLCRLAGIKCAEVYRFEGDSIKVKNITSTDLMLEQADMSGKFDPDYYTDMNILKAFGIDGFNMLLIDAIFANGDRHLGNFGWLRNANTGAYVCMAPLYDFDHAMDSKLIKDRMTNDIINIINKGLPVWKSVAETVCNIVIVNAHTKLFKDRAEYILSEI